MSAAAVAMSHELLRDEGWKIEMRTTRASHRRFFRESYIVYVSPDGEIVYELAVALRKALSAKRLRVAV